MEMADSLVRDFRTWPPSRQAARFNSLSPESKTELLRRYLPGQSFRMGERDDVLFLDNGEVAFDHLMEDGHWAGGGPADRDNFFFVGHWRMSKGERFQVWAEPDERKKKSHTVGDWNVLKKPAMRVGTRRKNGGQEECLVLHFEMERRAGGKTTKTTQDLWAVPTDSPSIQAYQVTAGGGHG